MYDHALSHQHNIVCCNTLFEMCNYAMMESVRVHMCGSWAGILQRSIVVWCVGRSKAAASVTNQL